MSEMWCLCDNVFKKRQKLLCNNCYREEWEKMWEKQPCRQTKLMRKGEEILDILGNSDWIIWQPLRKVLPGILVPEAHGSHWSRWVRLKQVTAMEEKAGKSSAPAKSVPTVVVHSWSTGHHGKDPCWNNLWRTISWERLQAKVGEQYEEATTETKCYEQVPKPILQPTLIHSWGEREDRRMKWSWINEDRIKELSLRRRNSVCLDLFLTVLHLH